MSGGLTIAIESGGVLPSSQSRRPSKPLEPGPSAWTKPEATGGKAGQTGDRRPPEGHRAKSLWPSWHQAELALLEKTWVCICDRENANQWGLKSMS